MLRELESVKDQIIEIIHQPARHIFYLLSNPRGCPKKSVNLKSRIYFEFKLFFLLNNFDRRCEEIGYTQRTSTLKANALQNMKHPINMIICLRRLPIIYYLTMAALYASFEPLN